MNFLNSGLLPLLAPLAALPLAIHLLNRKFPKAIPFPDLERLRQSLAERSKLARWRHWVMTVLRTLAVLAALIAFLRPVLPRLGASPAAAASATRRVLIVLDRSLSLEHQAGSDVPASRQAVIEAGKILGTLGPNDAANIVVAGLQPRTLQPAFSPQTDALRTAMAVLPPATERAALAPAVGLAANLLQTGAGRPELYFISDFQRSNWADIDLRALPESTRGFFVDAARAAPRHNTALLEVTTAATTVSPGESVRIDARAANFSPEPVTMPVEAIVDGRQSVAGEIRLAPWASGRISLEIAAPGEGWHFVEVRTQDDALPADNRRWLRLEVRPRQEVLVLTDAPAEGTTGAVFVMTALDPYDNHSGAYAPRRTPTDEVTPGQLATASSLVLTQVGPLSQDLVRRIAGAMEQGSGLIYFLDGENDRENLAALNEAAGGSALPFHLAGRLTTENFGGAPQKLARGDFDSRFLRLFRGSNRQALSLLEFYAIQRALPTGRGEVVLSFADGTPALGIAEIGLGTAVLANFAPAELSSNLARQRLFPAWMQEIVRNLRPLDRPESAPEVGSTLTVDGWRRDLEGGAFTGPDGRPISLTPIADGERATATVLADRPGMYTLTASGRPVWMGIANPSPEEADLRAMDNAELTRRASDIGQGGAGGHFVSGLDDYEQIAAGKPMHHWFLIGLATLLLVEMLMFRPFQRTARASSP
ncbi:MAG: BatA domain-containing protein [Verrucomicrobiales bacterium]